MKGWEITMKKTTRKIFPGIIIIAFITAAITFFLLLNIEKNLLSNYEKGIVWVAAADLKEGLEISNTNLEACFVQVEIDKKVIPESAIADIHDLDGGYSVKLGIDYGTAEHIAGYCIKHIFLFAADLIYITRKHGHAAHQFIVYVFNQKIAVQIV